MSAHYNSAELLVIVERLRKDLRRMTKEAMQAHGLSYASINILLVLKAAFPYTPYIQEIKDAVRTDFSHARIEDLLAQGFIQESAHPTNTTVRCFHITSQGQSILKRLHNDLHSLLVNEWEVQKGEADEALLTDVLLAGFERHRRLSPNGRYQFSQRVAVQPPHGVGE